MATTKTISDIPSNFFQRFVEYDARGNLDPKKSVKAFEVQFGEWLKEQGEIKPAILAELEDHTQLGEGKLTNFVMHRLRMKPTKENADRIGQALEELQRSGKINYKTTESGQKKGRGTGFHLSGSESKVA